MSTYFRRLAGSFALDPGSFEDVEADHGATVQAGATVVLASAAAGIGAQGFGGELWAVRPVHTRHADRVGCVGAADV